MKGILLIDKEPDWTSSDVVAKLRGMLNQKRVGHAGTLDPMATGLLVVMVGRATKAVEYAEQSSKRYLAKLRLGITTDTEDITGNILSSNEVKVTEAQVAEALNSFTGDIEQVPPMYSAIKIKGQKLYKIARAGGEVHRETRKIHIDSLKLAGRDGEDYILDIRCSKGTYVRSLCRDIGGLLGCGGCMSGLRRTEIGDFRVENAVKISQVQEAKDRGEAQKLLIPLDELFASYPAYKVTQRQEKRIRCGNYLSADLPEGIYRVYSESGEFIALSRMSGGQLNTLKSFYEV